MLMLLWCWLEWGKGGSEGGNRPLHRCCLAEASGMPQPFSVDSRYLEIFVALDLHFIFRFFLAIAALGLPTLCGMEGHLFLMG